MVVTESEGIVETEFNIIKSGADNTCNNLRSKSESKENRC